MTNALVTDVLSELRSRGTHKTLHSGRTLEAHLQGTHDILRAWGEPERVRLAGLTHSLYSTDTFRPVLVGLHERPYLQSLIGEEAERLVHLFCSLARADFRHALETANLRPDGCLAVRDRLRGGVLALSAAEAGDLAVMHLANGAEQAYGPGRFPTRWLTRALSWARLAERHAEVVPPVFDHCVGRVRPEAEDCLLAAYGDAFAVGYHRPATITRLAQAAGDVPWVGEPLILLAMGAAVEEDFLLAGELTNHGEALLEEWATPWDKRLDLQDWRRLCSVVRELCAARGRRVGEVRAAFMKAWATAAGSPPALLDALAATMQGDAVEGPLLATEERREERQDALPAGDDELPPRFAKFMSRLVANSRGRLYPGLDVQPWYDPAQFALARELEAAATEIQAEVGRLQANWFQPEAEAIPRAGHWDVFFLYERGRQNKEHCGLCPVTTSIIERHRIHRSLGGMIYFSSLAPGTYVAPHRGPTNMRLRLHLGLSVPPNCGMKVAGQTAEWSEGRCLVFSDRFVHEVWNWSDQTRIVLVVDFWHPDMSDREVELVDGLYRFSMRNGDRWNRYLTRNDRAAIGKDRAWST